VSELPAASCGCEVKVPATAYVPLIVIVPVKSGPLLVWELGLGVDDGSIDGKDGVGLAPGLGAHAAHVNAVTTIVSQS